MSRAVGVVAWGSLTPSVLGHTLKTITHTSAVKCGILNGKSYVVLVKDILLVLGRTWADWSLELTSARAAHDQFMMPQNEKSRGLEICMNICVEFIRSVSGGHVLKGSMCPFEYTGHCPDGHNS